MEKLMNSKAKIKTIFRVLFLLFYLKGLSSCKKNNYKIEFKDSIVNKIVYKEIKDYHVSSNYIINPVKHLDIKFQNYNFKIGYIENRAYLQYVVGSNIIQNWKAFNVNFDYDSSYEFVEKNIHILYNSKLSEGILLIPSFTEEYSSFFLYKFNSKNIQFISDIELGVNLTKSENKNSRYEAIQQKNKINVSLFTNSKVEYKFVERDYTPTMDISPIEDIKSLNNESSDAIIGLWQLDCSIQNSGIEIYKSNNILTGSLALAPPAIFINISLEEGEKENIYYLKYLSQDMDAPIASENVINENDISKNENIGKIVKENDKLKLIWYGLYNVKTKGRTNIKSQFASVNDSNFVILKRCINTED